MVESQKSKWYKTERVLSKVSHASLREKKRKAVIGSLTLDFYRRSWAKDLNESGLSGGKRNKDRWGRKLIQKMKATKVSKLVMGAGDWESLGSDAE